MKDSNLRLVRTILILAEGKMQHETEEARLKAIATLAGTILESEEKKDEPTR